MDGLDALSIFVFLVSTFAASLVTGLAGFAFGIIAAGPWLHVLKPSQVTTLIVAFGLLIQSYSVWKLRAAIRPQRLLPFLIGSAFGVPLGVALLRYRRVRPFGVEVRLFLVWKLGVLDLRLGARTLFRRCVDVVMMAAALAFTFQGTFMAQAGTRLNGHYHHGYAQHRSAEHHHSKSHAVAHVHADGTVHKHTVDGGKGALKDHSQQPGCPCCWNMAIVVAVLPLLPVSQLDAVPRSRVAIENLDPYRSTEPDGPRRPPRPPSIA